MKQIHIWAAVVCLLLASCSDIRFGDDFLGDHPESSGATLDEMFSSAVNADRVLTKVNTPCSVADIPFHQANLPCNQHTDRSLIP